ncbi:MAG: Nif3-like dinuclear metal center hexameric protein [Ectothiorhodospiraceae bacterium]|nr:Nif3-like dinuclear metal center hexameric protein [Ectothiorhodospiraceae bacterium]
MTTVAHVLDALRNWAPYELSWDKDNVGLLIGSPQNEVNGILVSVDVTEAVLDEAVRLGMNCIVAHHPVIFAPQKDLRSDTYKGRLLTTAIKNDIAVIAMHTNADAAFGGVNHALASAFGLKNIVSLDPPQRVMRKFVCVAHLEKVDPKRIGTYLDGVDGVQWSAAHYDNDVMVYEIILPVWLLREVRKELTGIFGRELIAAHTITLNDAPADYGIGAVGNLPEPTGAEEFIAMAKEKLGCDAVRTNAFEPSKKISRVAVCGGAGKSYIDSAVANGADAFVTADLTYHAFEEHRSELVLIDAGHYETEHVFRDICAAALTARLSAGDSDLTVRSSESESNPVRYY